MKFDVIHNFISPVTGRIISDYNYVLVGDRYNRATPSPILIDIRLDIIQIRKNYNELVLGDFIIGHPNNQVPDAQVLSNLLNDGAPPIPEGYMYSFEGKVRLLSGREFGPSDATYILQRPHPDLPNAQPLSTTLDYTKGGMLKSVVGGVISIAIPDDDYATVDTLEALVEIAGASADAAGIRCSCRSFCNCCWYLSGNCSSSSRRCSRCSYCCCCFCC